MRRRITMPSAEMLLTAAVIYENGSRDNRRWRDPIVSLNDCIDVVGQRVLPAQCVAPGRTLRACPCPCKAGHRAYALPVITDRLGDCKNVRFGECAAARPVTVEMTIWFGLRRIRLALDNDSGSSCGTFTEAHILAITQAICDYRQSVSTDGPLYMGKDTHAVSDPAQRTALEVLAANNVDTIFSETMGSRQRRLSREPFSYITAAVAASRRRHRDHAVA